MTTTTASAPDRPAAQRAEGIELLGALGGSGYRDAPCLVRRADAQTLQLTPLLYALLEELDGARGPEQLAPALSAKVGREVSAEDVRFLLEEKLTPLGVLSGSEPVEAATSNPLLALRWKVVVSNPAATRRLTAPFAALFSPLILWPVLAAFVAVCWFVLVDKGLASATRSAFDTPGLLLAVFALGVLSAGFHELGHAAACRYGGATPGAMGAGLYLVWPAFYTDVDDSYRLDKKGRLRVDLGGLYFNALVAVAVTAAWLVTREDALLLGVALQLLQMLRQLAPVVRADGYHILADLTGVPDLFAHLGPTVKGMLPSNWGTPSPLTRKARVIVTAWVLVVIPILVSLLVTAVLLLPRLIATAWQSGDVQVEALLSAAESVDVLAMGAAVLQLFALLLPVAGTIYLLSSILRRAVAGTLRGTRERPFLRGMTTALAALLLLAVALAWWPKGQYDPVRADERGTLASLVSDLPRQPASLDTSLGDGRQLAMAMVPRGAAAATHPVLLLTRDSTGLRSLVTSQGGGQGTSLPFALPDAPGPGDTQALATNSTDGSVAYDVAYALVTVTEGDRVTNTNSAYALASCTDCTTVAVSFQVVLVVGQSDVVVPVNAAVADNRGCVRCVTTALAVQLVVTLNAQPSGQVQTQLDEALGQLEGLEGLEPGDIYSRVKDVEQQVLTILQDNGLVDRASSTSVAATATPTGSATADPGASPTQSSTSTASPSAAPTPQETPSPTPTATTTPSGDATPSAAAAPTP